MFEELFDFETDFTEEEELVFLPKGEIKLVVAPTGSGRTLEMKITDDYKAGVTVSEIIKKYRLSTGRLYDILTINNIPLRTSLEDNTHVFISEVARRLNLTDANIRGYCLILEKKGYNFKRISRATGGKSARIFTDKDIDIVSRMIDNMRQGFTMVESAALAVYNNDSEPPIVTVKMEGETLHINIERKLNWTADEINVVINLKEEK